jgi:hypothetical protein
MDNFGFIIVRHVNSEKTNQYWIQNVKLLNVFYPENKIIIIDDNSNYEFVKCDLEFKNVTIIQSEFHGRGELLPYYYFLKNRFFNNAVIIHDSVFFHKRFNFYQLNGVKVLPLWTFAHDEENVNNTKRIASSLKNYFIVNNKLLKNYNTMDIMFVNNNNKWVGCFGVQCYINWDFLVHLEKKYALTNMMPTMITKADRCSLERIMGIIFCTECPNLAKSKSLFGDIHAYMKWGYKFDEYMKDLKNKKLPKSVIKVWTGR